MDLPVTVLQSLYVRLKEPVRPRRGQGQAVWSRIRASAWATSADIDDLLLAMDPRLSNLPIEDLARALSLPFRPVFSRPRFLSAEPFGFRSLSDVDTIELVIFLECCGFTVDPAQMVSDVKPSLSTSRRLTSGEISVLRYRHTKGRGVIELRTAESARNARTTDSPVANRTIDEFVTSTRYHVFTILESDRPTFMRVTGPRPQLERVAVHCDYCNLDYVRGDPEEALQHRNWHRRWQRLLDPIPLRRMTTRIEGHDEPELVRADSPLWCHKEMYERAWAFKREMGFDFPQWGSTADGRDTDPNVHGYLMTDVDGRIFGACCFRLDGDRWNLCWVWVAPRYRRAGYLARRWPSFVTKFGDFSIEPPVSPSMQSFVLKSGTDHQRAEMREYQRRQEVS